MRLGKLRLVWLPAAISIASAATYNATPSNYRSLVAQLRPGDTLALAAGNYNLLPITNVHGAPSAWITITGPASGSPAVIQGNSCCNAVEILNSTYVAIRNLTIDSMGLDSDGIKAGNGLNNLTHHILIEGNTLVGQGASQQTVGISTKTPTWGWIVRRNKIVGAGTGMYFGASDGTDPFIGGLIENNLVQDSIGYDLQVKYQVARPSIAGMPAGSSVTVIRNNVFTKNDAPSPDGARPNVLVAAFPDSGPGSNDLYEIYGNLFFHNPAEALLQCSGRVSVHDNIFVDGQYAAAVFQAHDGALKVAYVYNNTVYTSGAGVEFGTAATVDDAVTGNLVFAASPLTGAIAHASNNITGPMGDASKYLRNPSFTLGAMEFYPLGNNLSNGAANSLSKFSSDLDYYYDVNGMSRGLTGYTFRGAYGGQGTNPGWALQAAIKPATAAAAPLLDAVACQPSAFPPGGSAVCTAMLTSPATSAMAVALSYSGPIRGAADVTFPAGASTVSFTVVGNTVTSPQTATVTGALQRVMRSDTVTVGAATLGVSSLVCAPATLTAGGTASCTATLTAAAPSPTVVAIASGNAALTAPSSLTVASGATAASFTAVAGTVASTQTAQLTASLNGISAWASVTLNPPPPPLPGVSSVACSPATLTPGATSSCAVTLTAAVTSATAVAISLSNTFVTAPGSITVAAGSSAGQVTVTGGAVSTTQTAVVTAALNSSAASATLTINAAPLTTAFYLAGNTVEIPNPANGAPIAPTTAPSGVTGSFVLRGAGAATFTPVVNGDGVAFAKSGAQQTNTAFLSFAGGAALGSIFDSRRGDLTFYLRSNHSFAERSAMVYPSYVFDADDGVTQRLFFFNVSIQSGRLAFVYRVGSYVSMSYLVPAGTEDQVLGAGVLAKVRLAWDGSRAILYLNDAVVSTQNYTPLTAAWNSSAAFSFGSTSTLFFGGGYYTCDDVIAEFRLMR